MGAVSLAENVSMCPEQNSEEADNTTGVKPVPPTTLPWETIIPLLWETIIPLLWETTPLATVGPGTSSKAG